MDGMVLAIVRWGGLPEEPPISVRNATHMRRWGRTDVRWGRILVGIIPPKTERGKRRQNYVNPDWIGPVSMRHLSGGVDECPP